MIDTLTSIAALVECPLFSPAGLETRDVAAAARAQKRYDTGRSAVGAEGGLPWPSNPMAEQQQQQQDPSHRIKALWGLVARGVEPQRIVRLVQASQIAASAPCNAPQQR